MLHRTWFICRLAALTVIYFVKNMENFQKERQGDTY